MNTPTPKYAGIRDSINLNNRPSAAQLKGLDPMPEATDSSLATRREPEALATIGATMDPVLEQMMRLAKDAASMKDVLDMYRTLQKDKARVLYHEALSQFKDECPPIPRTRENAQFKVTRNGETRASRYSALEDIETTIRPHLKRRGLSFRWGDVTVADGMMIIECIIAHVGGHSESSKYPIPIPAEGRGGSSVQQNIANAGTYARRLSLMNALGLTTCDEDSDGQAPATVGLTAHQIDNYRGLLSEIPNVNEALVLKAYGVGQIEDLPPVNYPGLMQALEKRRAGK